MHFKESISVYNVINTRKGTTTPKKKTKIWCKAPIDIIKKSHSVIESVI